MSISLCDLADRLPALIGALLDRESLLQRGRFREETMTDILTGSLAAFSGPELVIEYPVEAETGGDLDLQFWHVESDRSLLLRLQAKRLNAQTEGQRTVRVQHRAYGELLHRPPSTPQFQYKTLSGTPAPWLPLYMFYNHRSVVRDPYFAAPGPEVSGINLAFASDIASELDDKVAAAQWKPREVKHHKRLSHLRRHLFGLETILCPPGDWSGAGVPSPDLVAAALLQAWNGHPGGPHRTSDADQVLRALSRPDELLASRRISQLISSGPAVRVARSVERPVITFISGRTDDGRTPYISGRDTRET